MISYREWDRQADTGNNILDLILTSEDDLRSSVSVGESLGISDYRVVKYWLGVQTTPKKLNVRRKINFHAVNFGGFQRDLKDLPYPVYVILRVCGTF